MQRADIRVADWIHNCDGLPAVSSRQEVTLIRKDFKGGILHGWQCMPLPGGGPKAFDGSGCQEGLVSMTR